MVPIVTETVAGEKLSIYDPSSDASHALNGFRLKNNTGLHLAGGPITVFQGGSYAGDAQITNLQPGEERLLAYAVDLDLVTGQQNPKYRQDTLSVSAKSGVLTITRKQQQERTYTFRNKAAQPKVVLVEQFIQGREFSVPVLGSGPTARALPIVEIVAPEGNYDYQNKYFTDDTKYHCPAPLDAATTRTIQAHVVDAYRALGCEGWSRIDVLLRAADNEPFLLEVNTSPGMTTHSLVPMAARAEGTSYEDLCVDILRSASLKAGQVKKG